MSFLLFVDSMHGVSFDPEYDYLEEDRKVEDTHRARSGKSYVYRWGGFKRFKLSVRYVDSAFRAVVNSWWDSNAELLLQRANETQVFSVRLVNDKLPVGKYEVPHDDLWQAELELETY